MCRANFDCFTTITAVFASALLFTVFPRMICAAVMPLDQIQQLAVEGDYGQAIKELDRIQKLNPDCAAAHPYDFYEVAMLAADCQLHVGNKEKTLKAADTAIDLADAADDQDRLARATALYVMVDRAKGGRYIPKTGDVRTPIAILNANSRQTALPFILADELDGLKDSKWKFKARFSLMPVIAAARHFAGVRALEHLVTGKTNQTERLGIVASKDIHDLVIDWTKDRNHDLTRIANDAAKPIKRTKMTRSGVRTITEPTSLGDDRKAVSDILADCSQMPDAMEKINKGFGGSLQLDGVYRASDDLKQKAQNLLDKYPNN